MDMPWWMLLAFLASGCAGVFTAALMGMASHEDDRASCEHVFGDDEDTVSETA